MNVRRNKRIFFIICIAVFLFPTIAFAGTHAGHYDKYFFYEEWSYNGDPGVEIYYYYDQLGSYYFGYRILLAELEWEEGYGTRPSPFVINEVSDAEDANLYIESDNYGNTGWVGRAYYNRNPKEIQINEWYLANSSSTPHNYTYDCYTNTVIHEMGHTHGLDHYDCPTDGEIMEPVHMDKYDLSEGDWDGIFDIY